MFKRKLDFEKDSVVPSSSYMTLGAAVAFAFVVDVGRADDSGTSSGSGGGSGRGKNAGSAGHNYGEGCER